MLLNVFKYSAKNILRNKFLTISTILVLTLLMFFINVLQILDNLSAKVISEINSKLSISLYLKDEFNDKSIEVTTLKNNILSVNKDIKFDYKTKEKILQEMKLKDPDVAKILESENPLPETITLSNISLEDYEKVNSFVENQLSIFINNQEEDYFANYRTQYKRIIQVINFLDSWDIWFKIVVLSFFVSIAIITYSVIWNFIYYFRNEIYITRLVWGAKSFIYWPFILQWIVYSIISFFISIFLFSILLKNLNLAFWEFFDFYVDVNIILLELFIFIFMWAISWYLSSKKYLKQL